MGNMGNRWAPDSADAREATVDEKGQRLYNGLSYNKFIDEVHDIIRSDEPKFLMVFLLSHGNIPVMANSTW